MIKKNNVEKENNFSEADDYYLNLHILPDDIRDDGKILVNEIESNIPFSDLTLKIEEYNIRESSFGMFSGGMFSCKGLFRSKYKARIGIDGANTVAKALASTKKLTSLNLNLLDGNFIMHNGLRALAETFEKNKTLINFRFVGFGCDENRGNHYCNYYKYVSRAMDNACLMYLLKIKEYTKRNWKNKIIQKRANILYCFKNTTTKLYDIPLDVIRYGILPYLPSSEGGFENIR